MKFELQQRCSATRARAGRIETTHGIIETPVFMPVGTQGTVKGVTPEELLEAGAQIILGNTYHLHLRPGCEVIERFGGLHRFMNWPRPILTDSGGFQVFSLARLARVDEQGVAFQSHIDGARLVLTPERAVAIQRCLGADVMMCLDQCIGYPSGRRQAAAAVALTTGWAARCKSAFETAGDRCQALFGIVQGGMFADLRRQAADQLLQIGFDGYALGGLSVGEPQEVMLEVAGEALACLPEDAPRYVMGVGTPADLVALVRLGADMFDCVLPTRNARNGQVFTAAGTLNLRNARYREDTGPIDAGCGCYTCRRYARAYLRHLLIARELLAYRLLTLHNLHFFLRLLADLRQAILEGGFEAFSRRFLDGWAEGSRLRAAGGG